MSDRILTLRITDLATGESLLYSYDVTTSTPVPSAEKPVPSMTGIVVQKVSDA
jgi:hypothetical protein